MKEIQLILWTERPTAALVDAGSLWPLLTAHKQVVGR